MRGKGVKQSNSRIRMGITPAYAGKSCIYRSTTSISWDHPRVCGEKSFKTSTSCWSKGSPPRMRGKGIQPCNQWVRVGITPAYAGKRPLPSSGGTRVRDHPRVCGEKKVSDIETAKQLGSPPRMRGKAWLPKTARAFSGITPAYAGKSRSILLLRTKPKDHPRVCGEKYFTIRDKVAKKGSPPRMRGKD